MLGSLRMPDAQLIEILIAAMVAGVVLFRLYTILGRRTGHEPQSQDRIAPASSGANLRALSADRVAEPQARSLFDIQLADPSFETGHFLKGARAAYEIILKAFTGGDRTSLKPLLSDDVYKAFDAEIARRGAAPAARLWRASPMPRSCMPRWKTRRLKSPSRSAPSSPAAQRRPTIMSSAMSPTSGPLPARSARTVPLGRWSLPAARCPDFPGFGSLGADAQNLRFADYSADGGACCLGG